MDERKEARPDGSLVSPNTSTQLGKYITNGLEMLSLSDMKIVMHRHESLDDARSESFVFDDVSVESAEREDVYLASIYETYSRLNEKVDMLVRRDCFDRSFVKQILRDICNGEGDRARDAICRELRERDPCFSSVQYRMYGVGSFNASEMMREIQAIEDVVARLRTMFFEMRSRAFDAELRHSRTHSDLTEQIAVCSRELEDVRRSRNALADDIREIAECVMEGRETWTSEDLKSAVRDMCQRAKKDWETVGAGRHEEATREIEQLQRENLMLSEAVTTLSEKNAKMKRSCAAMSDAFRKTSDSSKRRGATIDRQRRIIDILQSKVGADCLLPMEELQTKIDEIRQRMEREPGDALMADLVDYERRMADFLSLVKKDS